MQKVVVYIWCWVFQGCTRLSTGAVQLNARHNATHLSSAAFKSNDKYAIKSRCTACISRSWTAATTTHVTTTLRVANGNDNTLKKKGREEGEKKRKKEKGSI